MDIAFCTLNLQSQLLSYAGANNPIWIVSKQKELCEINGNPLFMPYPDLNTDYIIYEIKPDKQPIGFGENIKDFTNHTVQLQKSDFLYLFTDGYADQFGGEKGKKFKYKQLAKLLINNVNLEISVQKTCIHDAFINWKQNNEQVDDVCIIGVKI
jgi:serine phosphatase RsbU (regulator of sigma subunit)